MTKQSFENFGASCSVDALALALQKLELLILQSNDALNNRVELLETKFDGFQSFLADIEKTRTQNNGLVLNAIMTMTNNSMMPPPVPVPPQQPPVLPTPQQTPLFSQPPSAALSPAVFSTPAQPPVPAMQSPRIPQPLFSSVTATPPVITPSTVVGPSVSKPAPVASIFDGGFKSGFMFGTPGEQSSLASSFGFVPKQEVQPKPDADKKTVAPTAEANVEETGGATEAGNDESPEAFVPDQHYKPVIPLPQKVEVQTGEEDEQKLFEAHAKLYVNTFEGIKERGIGSIKILSKNDRCRSMIPPQVPVPPQQPTVLPTPQQTPLFSQPPSAVFSMPAQPSVPALFGTPGEQSSPASLFGFFAKQEVEVQPKPDADKKIAAPTAEANVEETGGDGGVGIDESPEAFVPDQHYEPVIPLAQKVEVQTGEEDEQKLFEAHAKLYVNTPEGIKERGQRFNDVFVASTYIEFTFNDNGTKVQVSTDNALRAFLLEYDGHKITIKGPWDIATLVSAIHTTSNAHQINLWDAQLLGSAARFVSVVRAVHQTGTFITHFTGDSYRTSYTDFNGNVNALINGNNGALISGKIVVNRLPSQQDFRSFVQRFPTSFAANAIIDILINEPHEGHYLKQEGFEESFQQRCHNNVNDEMEIYTVYQRKFGSCLVNIWLK
uniref:RanBD1 domain-containing protein n=1 Tax=Panagrolaimus sp. JU765 TaxID=591449 RepID=A0AC34QMQ6_9BILA